MNITSGLEYIIIDIYGLEQRITAGVQPTKYMLILVGDEAGRVIPMGTETG